MIAALLEATRLLLGVALGYTAIRAYRYRITRTETR